MGLDIKIIASLDLHKPGILVRPGYEIVILEDLVRTANALLHKDFPGLNFNHVSYRFGEKGFIPAIDGCVDKNKIKKLISFLQSEEIKKFFPDGIELGFVIEDLNNPEQLLIMDDNK